jgi:hypothetical protein
MHALVHPSFIGLVPSYPSGICSSVTSPRKHSSTLPPPAPALTPHYSASANLLYFAIKEDKTLKWGDSVLSLNTFCV